MTAAAEGRCSGELCWYTLPLVDGLVVDHSKSGTLDVCEGGGRPPLTAPAPDPRIRDQVRDVLRKHHPIMRSETGPFSGCRCGQVKLGQDVIAHVVAHALRALAQPAGTEQEQGQ